MKLKKFRFNHDYSNKSKFEFFPLLIINVHPKIYVFYVFIIFWNSIVWGGGGERKIKLKVENVAFD